ncbi:hypothetical protein Hdeb2414_s0002g00066531 [Helianthus debilis subsp. tardiflorus]
MSGEESSATAGGRKRGPRARPRGTGEQPPPSDFRKRKIKYHTAEVIPHGRSTRLKDSPLLQFDIDTSEYAKLDELITVNLLPFKRIDWELLDRLGQRERIEQYLGSEFRLALDCDALQYKELTLEFHATFQYKQGNYAQSNAVSFSLGRQVHEMTIPHFVVMTHFYTQEEVETDEFATSLRGVFAKQHDHSLLKNELARFWNTISHMPFSAALVSSDIVDPVYRFLHESLSATLVGRGTSENEVDHVELFCMMCMIENRSANLASVLAWSIKRTWRGGAGDGIYCGPYVMRIAESLGVFTRCPANVTRKGPISTWISLKELQGSGIVTLIEPIEWEPIKQGPQV